MAGIAATPSRSYGLALATVAVISLAGLVAAVLLPKETTPAVTSVHPAETPPGAHG